MKKVIESKMEFLENGGTLEGYYKQFDTVKELELGKKYVNNPNNFMRMEYTIVYSEEKVALGVSNEGHRELFHSSGMRIGWVYDDNRPAFRLQEII